MVSLGRIAAAHAGSDLYLMVPICSVARVLNFHTRVLCIQAKTRHTSRRGGGTGDNDASIQHHLPGTMASFARLERSRADLASDFRAGSGSLVCCSRAGNFVTVGSPLKK